MYGNALWKFMFDLLLLSDLMKVIKLCDFIVIFSDMKFCKTPLVYMRLLLIAFSFFHKTCIYAKVTASTPFESWFKDSPQ